MHPWTKMRAHPYAAAGAFVLLFLGALVIAVASLSDAAVSSFISKKASQGTGRDFAIEGPFSIRWNWTTPHIHAEKIRLSNLPGREDPYMVDIGAADFRIKIWPLLVGHTVIPELKLDHPRVVLEKIDEDTKNWDMPIFSKSAAVADAALPDNRHDFPEIDSLAINAGELVYRDIPDALALNLKLDTATGSSADEQSIRVEGDGSLQDRKFSLSAQGGSIDMLRDTSKDYPLAFDLTMGATRVHAQGKFKDPVKMEGIDARLEVSGDNMADLFYLTAIPLPPTPPYKLAGELGKKGEVWSYTDFSGTVGDSDLAGDLNYDTGGERGFLKADLTSQRMDADDLGGFIGLAPSTDAGETASAKQQRQAAQQEASPRLLPDAPLNLKRLRATDLDVTLKVAKLESESLPFKGMNVRARLDHGLLTLEPMDLTLADGTVDGKLVLDGREDIPKTDLNVDFRQLRLNRFFSGTQFEKNTQANIGAHVELAGSGKSFADALGSSDGRVVAIVSQGTISLLLVEASDIDLAEAAPLFLGDDKTTRVRCGVGDFKVKDGLLTSQVFVLDTEDSTVQGDVKVDLKNEGIDARLQADPKDGSVFAVQTPIVVRGPLKSPNIGIEPVETGARAGAAAVLGAILTPLAAIIPFVELGEGEDQNCKALVARAQADAKKGS